MPTFRTGVVTGLLASRRGLQRVEVDGEPAYVLTDIVGEVDVGDRVVMNTTAVDAGLGVGVYELEAPGTLPLRTRSQFLRAAAAANTRPDLDGPAVICRGSRVDPGATVEGSVIMPGAVVPADAVVVRSLVAPHCQISAGTDIVDAVAHAGACLSAG